MPHRFFAPCMTAKKCNSLVGPEMESNTVLLTSALIQHLCAVHACKRERRWWGTCSSAYCKSSVVIDLTRWYHCLDWVVPTDVSGFSINFGQFNSFQNQKLRVFCHWKVHFLCCNLQVVDHSFRDVLANRIRNDSKKQSSKPVCNVDRHQILLSTTDEKGGQPKSIYQTI
jgi:hypothetical protein